MDYPIFWIQICIKVMEIHFSNEIKPLNYMDGERMIDIRIILV